MLPWGRLARHGGLLSDWKVYVLMNGAGTTYTGIAIDLEERLARHNAGAGAKFTRGRGPWRIVHVEGPLSHGDALRREAAIKADRAFKALLRRATMAIILFLCGVCHALAQSSPADLGVRVEKAVGDGKTFAQGSGVLIGGGLVVTAAHVVKYNPTDAGVIVLVEGQRVRGRVVFSDAIPDVALIKVERSAIPPLSRSRAATFCDHDPGPGEPVVVDAIGQVTRSKTIVAPDNPPYRPVDWNATLGTGYHQGSSGGGVFDAVTGCLLGILIYEVSGRVRPSSPFIDITRFAPAPQIAAALEMYRQQQR